MRSRCTLLANPYGVRRILFVIRGELEHVTLGEHFEAASSACAELALCYELPPGRDGLQDGLVAQRQLTALLRLTFGTRAETIAVFVATERSGEHASDYATAWGATEVRG